MMARFRILLCGRGCIRGNAALVAAGTIHAIGAGLVIAEVQQRSDATFRLFDFGRGRELHIDNALAVANAGPAKIRVAPTRLSDTRTLLVSNSHFTFERIDLAPDSPSEPGSKMRDLASGCQWQRSRRRVRLDGWRRHFRAVRSRQHSCRTTGLAGLVAYTGSEIPQLLQCVDMGTIR